MLGARSLVLFAAVVGSTLRAVTFSSFFVYGGGEVGRLRLPVQLEASPHGYELATEPSPGCSSPQVPPWKGGGPRVPTPRPQNTSQPRG